jgi:hypothetical protein
MTAEAGYGRSRVVGQPPERSDDIRKMAGV